MTDQQRPSWRTQVARFFAYMRSKGHRQTFLQFGQMFRPLGVGRFPNDYRNDNAPGQPQRADSLPLEGETSLPP